MSTPSPSQRPTRLLNVLRGVITIAAASHLFAFAGEATNKVGITLVDIPAGSFTMGGCKAAIAGGKCAHGDADGDEAPQHAVTIRAFQLGKTEVTLGQFKQYVAATKRNDLVDADFLKFNNQGDNAPVVHVSWQDVQGFIDWLNKTDGGGYRLPTEAEWEYACRAGANTAFCGSDDGEAVAWHEGNADNHIHPVATKAPNAFGLYDMSGNVWEWVQDTYHKDYTGAPTDGSAWTTGGLPERVQRGGSWAYKASSARATYRNDSKPTLRSSDIGFRLARSAR